MDLLLDRLRDWLRKEQEEALMYIPSSSSGSSPWSGGKSRRQPSSDDDEKNNNFKTMVERLLDTSITLRQSNARVRDELLSSAATSPIRLARSRSSSRRCQGEEGEEDYAFSTTTVMMTPDRHARTGATETPPLLASSRSGRKGRSSRKKSTSATRPIRLVTLC